MQNARSIFVNFLMREGWTQEQATTECDFVDGKTKDQYVYTARIGATKPLNRKEKMSVYMAWENAQNHATFDQ